MMVMGKKTAELSDPMRLYVQISNCLEISRLSLSQQKKSLGE